MSEELTGRVNQLEESLAHHQSLVQDLSDELAKQWQTIERLNRHIKELEDKIETLGAAVDAPETSEPPPPHY